MTRLLVKALTALPYIVILGIIAIALASAEVLAHEHWADGTVVPRGLEDPVSHKKCCGQSDCVTIDETRVERVPTGYLLMDTGEFITSERAQPSPDGHYWACRWAGQTQCFFIPALY